MRNVSEFVDRYVAMWHEADATLRRVIVRELWAVDGADVMRTLDARGYEAIEARVTTAHEKWIREGGFVFRSLNNVASHHNVVKFNWEMVPAAGGKSEAVGFDFFILDDDGRIRILYQFGEPPTPTDELNRVANRYVAVWNEPDPGRRRSTIAELWTADGAYIDPSAEDRGYDEIEAAVTKAYDEFVTKGYVFRSANNADGHHDAVRFNWEMVPAGGGAVAAVGFDFLVFDGDGRIRADYQFIETPPGA